MTDYPERPECTFGQYELNLGDDCPVTAETSCANCAKRIKQIDAIRTKTEDYCSEHCANEDTLARIRREGGA